jgi:Rad3-related DNA helicase
MDRGVDLHDDLARFAVLLKVPFPSLGDKQVSARFYGSSQGKSWYRWVTTCNVVQISGRAVRNSSDFADTYILDRQFERFYGENSGLFPAWWRDSLIVQ